MLEKVKKCLRTGGIILLIVLALSGIGLPGATRLPTRHRKENEQEQVEEKKEKENSSTVNFQ